MSISFNITIILKALRILCTRRTILSVVIHIQLEVVAFTLQFMHHNIIYIIISTNNYCSPSPRI